jgi:hypothetical protein
MLTDIIAGIIYLFGLVICAFAVLYNVTRNRYERVFVFVGLGLVWGLVGGGVLALMMHF